VTGLEWVSQVFRRKGGIYFRGGEVKENEGEDLRGEGEKSSPARALKGFSYGETSDMELGPTNPTT